jgi:hypothetical protein
MSNLILSHCSFIHIPKCGGSALNSAFWRLGLVTDRKTQVIPSPNYGHLFPHQMPESEKPLFTFVRDPVSWWLSFYHWNMNVEHSRFSEEERTTVSFDEWLRDYGPSWLGYYSSLVRRYTGKDINFPSTNKVELIGRNEYLYTDLRTIFNVIGQPYNAVVMRRLISGDLQMDEKFTNIQNYDRNAVSMESRELIFNCEQYVYANFGYKL